MSNVSGLGRLVSVTLVVTAAAVMTFASPVAAWGTFSQTCNGGDFGGGSYEDDYVITFAQTPCKNVRVRWRTGAGYTSWTYGTNYAKSTSVPSGGYGGGHGAFNPVTPPGGGWLNRNT